MAKSILDLVDRKIVEPAPGPEPVPTPDPVPDPTPTPIPDPTPTPAPAIDRLGVLKETFGQPWESEDEFNTWKESISQHPTKIKEYEDRVTQLQKEKEDLEKSFDPRSLFASDELYVLNGLLKKFPDKNPATMTEISTKDFSKSYLDNPVDVLAMDLMLEHPGIYSNKSDAEDDVRARYNIEEQDENGNWLVDAKAKRRMQVDAKTAVDKFADLRSQIELPQKVDRSAENAAAKQKEDERITKITKATEPLFTKIIPAELKAIDFEETIHGEDGKEVNEVAFRFEIGDGYVKSKAVQDILTAIRQTKIREATEWTPEMEADIKEELVGMLRANYLYKHRKELYSAMRDDLFTKYKDEAWMKRHRPRPLREDTSVVKPDVKSESLARKQDEFLRARGIKV